MDHEYLFVSKIVICFEPLMQSNSYKPFYVWWKKKSAVFADQRHGFGIHGKSVQLLSF